MKDVIFFPNWRRILSSLLLTGILFLSLKNEKVFANKASMDRSITSKFESSLYEWWLVYWSNNSVACDFFIEHEGDPTDLEIQNKCSLQLYQSWFNSPSCENSTNSYSKKCTGTYLHLVSTTQV
jgi:hypothetical protein